MTPPHRTDHIDDAEIRYGGKWPEALAIERWGIEAEERQRAAEYYAAKYEGIMPGEDAS